MGLRTMQLWPKIGFGLLLAVTTLCGNVGGQQQAYAVMAPNTIRPNIDYLAAVTVQNIDGELQEVELKITGTTKSGQSIEIRESSRVPPDETQLIRLRVGELEDGDYTLTATGISPITFQESQTLEFHGKGNSVFIQTDKAIYRPGNIIQLRVLVLSPQLKPTVTGSIDVHVTDPTGSIIRQWDRVFTTRGVYAETLDLAERPVLGNWNCTVNVNGQLYSKEFMVAEYVLPKFQVDVDLPPFATFTDKVTATIRANYPLGKPVRGKATISVFPSYKSGYLQPYFKQPYKQILPISGKVDLELDLAKVLNLRDDFAREVVFDVVVEEELTKRRQNNTNSVSLHKYKEKLELIYTGEAYKPGMPYTCYLKISNQDGSIVRDDLNKVAVKSGFGSNPEGYGTLDYDIPQDGIIRLAFFAPQESGADVLGIEAKYKGQSQWFSTIPKAYSTSSHYLQARLASENPRVNSNVKIEVRTTEPIDTFSYVVLGRGNILNAGTVRNPLSNKQAFLLPTTRDMSPRARVVVSYFRRDGEIVSDALDFEVEGVLANKVEITMDKQQAWAGSTVEIEMKAKPNSFVGILAIDKSVRTLQSGNDIEEREVLNELKSYNAGSDPTFYPWVETIKNQQGSLSWHTGSRDSTDVYRQSGLIIFTRGYLPQNPLFTVIEENGKNRTIGRPILPPDAKTVQPDQGPGIEYEQATRPPLAGPYAFSTIPKPSDDLPKIFLRNDLPATWLFTNTITNSEGNAVLTVKVPELTNTTWTVSGFAINQLDGMGISERLPELALFQPFYVLANLPYSVRLGETLAVEMVVFNYLSQEVSAEVTLENPNGADFQFGSPNPNDVEVDETFIELFRTKRITISPEGKASLSFVITPKRVGELDLKIIAKSDKSGEDVVIKTLRVEGEGQTMRKSESFLIDLTNKGVEEMNITVDYPEHFVNGTKSSHIAVVPDPLGPAINFITNLIYLPTDCGEQNLIQILPPTIILDYMYKTGRSTNEKLRELKHLMGLGYQNQLNYLRNDGAFSPFGKKDGFGSIWLTAQTAGALQGASKYIDVDQVVIQRALTWVVSKQQRDGSFKEEGEISHKIQSDPIALTSLVVLGFLDNKRNLTSTLRNSMNKAIDYIALNWETLDDPYYLSVVTYALHKAIHPSKDPAFAALEGLSTETKDKKWWPMLLPEDWQKNPRSEQPNTQMIETAAYALLTLADRGSISDAVPVVNWLFSQQNSHGGYVSTSDTYVALKSLAEFNIGFSIQDRNTDMSVQYAYLDNVKRLEVTSAYPIRMLRSSLPEETDQVRIRATGSGVAVLQVNHEYNLEVTAAWPAFVLNPTVSRSSNAHHMQITACTHFIQLTSIDRSLMSVMEIFLPSGFTVNEDTLPAVRRFRGVKRVETDKEGSKVVIYFSHIEKDKELCPTLQAYRTHRVANQRPAHVLLYDYYDQTKFARSFYEVKPATLCDICEGEDCPESGCSRDSFASPYYEGNPFNDVYESGRLGGAGTMSKPYILVAMTVLTLVNIFINH